MNKRKNGLTVKMNRNNMIIGAIVLVVLLATGLLPTLIELVFGLIGLVIGLVFGLIGLVVGLLAGAIGLVVGLAPIIIPVAIVYYLVKQLNGKETEKAKNDFS